MIPRTLLLAVALTATAVRVNAAPVDPKTRSVSGSKQFIVYCPDPELRGRITGIVEEWKLDVFRLLGETLNRSKIPVVITVDKAQTTKATPVRFQVIATPEGPKIEINAEIGDDPAAINLRKQIVRAVLLDFAYRDRPPIRAGETYREAPWWLVDGAIEIFRRRDSGVASDLFQRLVENNKLPAIADFLALRDGNIGETAAAIDSAFAMALVQALVDQPNGRTNLANLLRHWPDNGDDPITALAKEFPALAGGGSALQKWWTLNLARFGAADRYKGLSTEETDRQLTAILSLEVTVGKAATKKKFAPGDFAEYLKLPGARAELESKQRALVALSTQANALLQPVISEYSEMFSLLARGKTRHIAERIASADQFRTVVLHRMGAITDYLNWYEATQLNTRSSDFDSYLKAAEEMAHPDLKPSPEISRYLDQIEKEYRPTNP